MHNTLGKRSFVLHKYSVNCVATIPQWLPPRAKEAAADSARTRVQPMVFDDDCKPNTAREVEERAEKAKDLNYTFAIGQRLLT